MRAAIYHGGGRITLEDVPRPQIGDGELLVRMSACGLCGSDLMRWYQDPRAPVVLGHEPVGTVAEAGEGAQFAVGESLLGLRDGGLRGGDGALRGIELRFGGVVVGLR